MVEFYKDLVLPLEVTNKTSIRKALDRQSFKYGMSAQATDGKPPSFHGGHTLPPPLGTGPAGT